MTKRIPRAPLVLIALLLLGGCMQNDNEIPESLMRHLVGVWRQQEVNPASSLQFYDDLSVKLTLHLPHQRVPIRLLSTVEMMKDDVLGISLGDRWKGPARITMASPTADAMTLHLPGDKRGEETTLLLRKVVAHRP